MSKRSELTTYIMLLILFVHGMATVCLAQQTGGEISDEPYGVVSDSLLQLEAYGPDPAAPYVYTAKELDVSFREDNRSIVALLDYHVRIKVFDSSAPQASLVAIPYYFQNGMEEVENIQGVTHTPSGQKVTLPEEAIRTININSMYNVKEFMMPAVEDGAVLEYTYRIRRRYIEELPDFFLAHQAPTSKARISITYPPYLRYKAVTENYEGRLDHHTERIDTSSVKKIFTIPQPEPLLRETWIARDVASVEEEAYISSLDNYRGKLKFQLSEFGVPRQKLENSWDFVVAQLRRNQDILGVINRNSQARKLGRSIKEALSSQAEVQDSIFHYVNSRANFSGAKSPYSNIAGQTVLRGMPADQAAINQTLISMLQGAGIEAWPVLISTREFGRINRSFPSFFQFNGQLAYSRIGDEVYFMDASFPHSQPNLIPVETYNETGLLLKSDSYAWREISPSRSMFAISIDVDARLDAEGNLSGTVRAENAGYPAQIIRQQASGGETPESILSQAVFDGYNNTRFSDVELTNVTDYEEPVEISAGFMLENYATSFSDGLQFRPMIVGYLMRNPLNEGERELPVTLDAPERLHLVYRIRLPEGYTMGSGTDNRTVELPGARLTESYRAEGPYLHYAFDIEIARKQFGPELYPQLMNLYKRWVELSNNSWLIKKK